jgi:hypothetical protein
MAARIDDDFRSAEYDGRVIATARYKDASGAGPVTGRLIRITTALAVVAVAVVAAVISYQHASSWCAHTARSAWRRGCCRSPWTG